MTALHAYLIIYLICYVFIDDYITTESGSIPYTPESPFTLTRVETSSRPLAAGLYNVSITEKSGGAGRRGSGLNCFVARVETNGSSYYYPLVSARVDASSLILVCKSSSGNFVVDQICCCCYCCCLLFVVVKI